MIKYALFKNHLTEGTEDCIAIIQERRIVNQEMLIEEMTGRGKSLTDTQTLTVINELKYVVSEHLKQGDSISTDMFTIMPTIKGKFKDSTDTYDVARHGISFNMKMGKAWSTDTSILSLQKVPAPVKTPLIISAEDRLSDTVDENLSTNGTLDIRGIDLKVNEEVDDEGIFFIVDQTIIKAPKYYTNTDKRVEVRVPVLTSGSICNIEIRKRYRSNKQLFTYRYDVTLSVI